MCVRALTSTSANQPMHRNTRNIRSFCRLVPQPRRKYTYFFIYVHALPSNPTTTHTRIHPQNRAGTRAGCWRRTGKRPSRYVFWFAYGHVCGSADIHRSLTEPRVQATAGAVSVTSPTRQTPKTRTGQAGAAEEGAAQPLPLRDQGRAALHPLDIESFRWQLERGVE